MLASLLPFTVLAALSGKPLSIRGIAMPTSRYVCFIVGRSVACGFYVGGELQVLLK